MNKSLISTSKIAKIAIFAALSFVLYMFPKFPLPLFPAFLELNFSDIPILLGGLILGPISGVLIVAFKVFLKLPFSGTLGVGELADLIIGIAFVLPPAIIYKNHRTLKGALIGLLVGTVVSILAAIAANVLIIVPVYAKVSSNGDLTPFVNACKLLVPSITKDNFYLLYSLGVVLPFNLIRCIIAVAFTFILYKRTAKLLCKI